MIRVFYGCARRHRPFYPGGNIDVITNDIDPKCYCNITRDIRDVLSDPFYYGLPSYDGLIFTPPCNYYSHANWRRDTSIVAQQTKDLLPLCINYCIESGLPFLVENVQNKSLLGNMFPEYQFTFGQHTFWSNYLSSEDLEGLIPVKQNKQYLSRNQRDGNLNVHIVIDTFLSKLHSRLEVVHG